MKELTDWQLGRWYRWDSQTQRMLGRRRVESPEFQTDREKQDEHAMLKEVTPTWQKVDKNCELI